MIFHVVPGDGFDKLLDQVVLNSECEIAIIFNGRGHESNLRNIKKRGYKYFECANKKKSVLGLTLAIRRETTAYPGAAIFLHSYYMSKVVLLKWFLPRVILIPVRHHNKINILLNNKKGIFLDWLVFKVSDAMVVVSKSVKETILGKKYLAKNILVINNGVPTDLLEFDRSKLKVKAKDRPIRIVSVGRIDPQKNYDFLLSIAQLLNARGLQTQYFIDVYGTGPEAAVQRLQNSIKIKNLENQVFLRGWSDNIQEELLNSDLLIHVSIDEACPMVLIEGLVLGVPIISSGAGGSRDVLEGLWEPISDFSENKYADRIEHFLADPDDYFQKANRIREIAYNKFSAEKMAQAYCKTAFILREINA